MNRIELKEMAKQQISGNIGVLLLMYIIIFAITGILMVIPAIGPFLGLVASILLEFSMIIIFLSLTPDEQPKISNLFNIFKNTQLCGNAVLLELLIGVYTFLWSLLFFVPGIIKAISYSMAPYILAENDYYMSPSDAIRESMRIMEGHKMDFFILSLSFIGWFLLSYVTCGIAIVYVIPYYNATITNFYNSIKDPGKQSYIII